METVASSLEPFIQAGTIAGAVTLVAGRDRVLALDAVGFADRAARAPMRTDALFWIASQTKPMTASALMMLVDEGSLRLDDPVERYLPEFRELWLAAERDPSHVLLRKPRHPITVREILSHTSGMPFASALEQPTLDMLPLRAAAGSYAITALDFEPGPGISTPTPESTPRRESSRLRADRRTRVFWTAGSSSRSGCGIPRSGPMRGRSAVWRAPTSQGRTASRTGGHNRHPAPLSAG